MQKILRLGFHWLFACAFSAAVRPAAMQEFELSTIFLN